MRQEAALGRRITCAFRAHHEKAIGNGRQKWRRGDSCVEKTCYKSRFFAEEIKALEERIGCKVKKLNTYNGFRNTNKKWISPLLWACGFRYWLLKKSRFGVTDCKRIRISRISGIIVRLANEKLTYSGIYSNSGISQTNAPLDTE